MKLYRIKNRQSFGFSAENPTGQKNGGTKGKDCEKLSPCIQIAPGETVTLCDTDGPGMITHIWFTGYDIALLCVFIGKMRNFRLLKHRFLHFLDVHMTKISRIATATTLF